MTSLIVQYFLNHRLDPNTIAWQVAALADAGYEGLYPHARPGMLTPYFSAAWWDAVDAIVEACRRTGLEVWIWDEDYFPSGLAGGRVVWEEPGLIGRGLDFTVERVEGDGPFEVDFHPGHLLRAFAVPERADGSLGEPVDVTPCCGTRRQRWGARYVHHHAYSPLIDDSSNPHWRTAFDVNRYALAWQPEAPGAWRIVAATVRPFAEVHPDLLRPEGIQRFLELSYEPYAERYGELFGTVFTGAFTDEPSPGGGQFPWTARFDEAFRADHGYSLVDHLAHLAVCIDDRSPVVRHHYRLTQHRLQQANYVAALADWCRAHGIKSAGHLTRTEWFSLTAAWWPNELRCYQPMDIPSADPLGASVGPPGSASHHSGLKVVSSAAHLFGRAQAGSDALAVMGDETRLRDWKFALDYHLVLGINHFTLHGASYSFEGPRKDEVPPSLFIQHSEFKHFPVLLDHVRTTAAALTGGEHVCEVAVLYPSTSLACQLQPEDPFPSLPDEALAHELSEALLSRQIDFDYLDELTLAERVDEAGVLHTAEPYRVILLPYLRYLDGEAAAALERYAAAGGRVVALGGMPMVLPASTPPNPTSPERERGGAVSEAAAAADEPARHAGETGVEWIDAAGGDTAETAPPRSRSGLATGGSAEVPPAASWSPSAIEQADSLDAVLADLPAATVEGDGANDVFVLRRRDGATRRAFAVNRGETTFTGRIEGEAVTLPPRGSRLLTWVDGRRIDPVEVPGEPVAELLDGWTVSFEPNQVPLNFWHVERPAGKPRSYGGKIGLPGFDLLRREADPAGVGEDPVRYWCRFLLTGQMPDARLLIEPATFGGDWTLYVNDLPVTDWQRARLFDTDERVAEIGGALRGGSTPTVNLLMLETSGPGRGLFEVPYLLGDCGCEYRYAHPSSPYLTAPLGPRALDGLASWEVLGHPTFSGTATYQRSVVTDDGEFWLDLGRVEDVAVVRVDGRRVDTLAWPPYRCRLPKLERGEHTLTIEVTNPPANRMRMARQVAGLLGPVRVLRA